MCIGADSPAPQTRTHGLEIYNPDDRDTALRLFELVNIIVEFTITKEKLIEEAYSEIPENKKDGIEQRDG
ncbi:hypothetical protein E2L06_12515 [Haloterrigena sp. H1]|nr:hypothetical protein E2L06_12515 [Haloterrigena sp. H1]